MPWQLERLSEKTLELNFASQLNHRCGGSLLWFGLTQKQEAECGFDIATRAGSALFIVQMKASSHVLQGSGARKFKVPDDQLKRLRDIKVGGKALPLRSVFYAFPVLGTVGDLTAHSNVLENTWLCDVADCGAVGAPTKADGSARKDGCHYVHVSRGEPPLTPGEPGVAEWHSNPVEVAVLDGGVFADRLVGGDAGSGLLSIFPRDDPAAEGPREDFWRLCESFHRKAFGIVRLNKKAFSS